MQYGPQVSLDESQIRKPTQNGNIGNDDDDSDNGTPAVGPPR